MTRLTWEESKVWIHRVVVGITLEWSLEELNSNPVTILGCLGDIHKIRHTRRGPRRCASL